MLPEQGITIGTKAIEPLLRVTYNIPLDRAAVTIRPTSHILPICSHQ